MPFIVPYALLNMFLILPPVVCLVVAAYITHKFIRPAIVFLIISLVLLAIGGMILYLVVRKQFIAYGTSDVTRSGNAIASITVPYVGLLWNKEKLLVKQ